MSTSNLSRSLEERKHSHQHYYEPRAYQCSNGCERCDPNHWCPLYERAGISQFSADDRLAYDVSSLNAPTAHYAYAWHGTPNRFPGRGSGRGICHICMSVKRCRHDA